MLSTCSDSTLPACARVKRAVRFDDVTAVNVGVDLRGGDVGVTEQLLNEAQVGAPFEQMGGERMPQYVRTHVSGNARRHRVRPQLLEEADA